MSDDIQKNEDIKGGQIAQTVQGNQIQINNNYFSIPSKALKNYDKEILVHKIHFTSQVRITLLLIFFSIFICSILFFLFPYFISVAEDGKKIIHFNKFLITAFMLLIICFAFYVLMNLVYTEYNTLKLKIENDKLILSSKSNKPKILEYGNIRSFRLEKNILGFDTNFFIYRVNEIEPYMSFKIISIHTLIAIEELLKYQINEAIKKENSKK
ncbi:hypothetical protein [Aliarcobacter lanthieri]|uniref:hypothetical protein n=1 Tax=Aliarcobacter lanthieri TaxID=1355374 RepID=UPI00047E4D07|nr:hypothetical protein [Aliarcobacter lanthieri]